MTTRGISSFDCDVHFCPCCGSVLPEIPNVGNVHCISCKYEVDINSFGDQPIEYEIIFNDPANMEKKKKKNDKGGIEGPTIERKCPKCGHNEMSYAALQLRSADEGQTVFFTCLKCFYKESENS